MSYKMRVLVVCRPFPTFCSFKVLPLLFFACFSQNKMLQRENSDLKRRLAEKTSGAKT